MNYDHKRVTISAAVSGYASGDYMKLYSDNMTGTMDYTAPITPRRVSIDADGTYELSCMVNDPGPWKFALITFDEYGNYETDGAETIEVYVCCYPSTPDRPSGIVTQGGSTILNR